MGEIASNGVTGERITRAQSMSSAPGHWVSGGLLLVSLGLTIATYFLYRGPGWPFGTQGLEGLAAIIVIAVTLGFGVWFAPRGHYRAERSLRVGLAIGWLWVIEICVNNFLTPPLPWRDIIDNIFWALVTVFILVYAISRAHRFQRFFEGVAAGLWAGFASGLVACTTGLLIAVFGIQLVVNDPLTLLEWQQVGEQTGLRDPVVFSAYETLFGALGHLHLIGTLMGAVVGSMAGLSARIVRREHSG